MNFQSALRIHLAALQAGRSDFEDTLALIDRFFEFTPTAFRNGPLENEREENGGSCRIFALGQLAGLPEQQTLACFGRHYRTVMDDPSGTSHANIRQFISTGWSGIEFGGRALVFRSSPLDAPDPESTQHKTNNGVER
ncbi:type III effector HopPmaJ [Marinobacter halodurans]|uniref:Type III effector HopPmaJ n=2 Tax=Marinobacter halodurans TaxID=2528979 RepID=A0ABY1ZJU3_9GAMM|nr:type III effector HopPmaJ [Marinobacter halodurans]